MKFYKVLIIAFLLSLGVVLTGCGDTGDDDPTDTPAAEMTQEMEMTEEADG